MVSSLSHLECLPMASFQSEPVVANAIKVLGHEFVFDNYTGIYKKDLTILKSPTFPDGPND